METEKQPHIQLTHLNDIQDAILVGDPARLNVLKTLLESPEELEYNREFRSIKGKYKGKEILGISTGIGAPSAAIALEELHNIGINRAIRVGSAGAYQSEIALGELIIGEGAVRCDGLSKKYVPIEYPAVPSFDLITKAHKYAPLAVYGLIRSHDGFYMKSNDADEKFWSDYGIVGADMESGVIMTIGRLYKMETLSILNNVVLWGGDLAAGVNDLVNADEKVAQGERASLQLALDILSD